MNKIITDELITKKLEAKGYLEYHDMDETKAWNLLEKHYDCEVSDQWSNNSFDFYCYSETTADGYEVFIATNNPDSVCISEDVHYYENDLSDEIATAMTDHHDLIYVDDLDADYVQDAVTSIYEEYANDIKQEVENELIEEGYKLEEQ